MFERERRAFQQLLPSLLATDHGRFAVVLADQVVGVFDTESEAFVSAMGRFGRQAGFFIAPIMETRDIAEIPALALGLVDAEVP